MAGSELPLAARLCWQQPKVHHRAYELLADGLVAGTLNFESVAGTRARAVFGDRAWTFRKTGFFHSRVLVREDSAFKEVAVFDGGMSYKGDLRFETGQHYLWRPCNVWQTRWAFFTPEGEEKLALEYKGLVRQSANIRISQALDAVEEAPLLTALGWYLVLLLQNEYAAVALASGGG